MVGSELFFQLVFLVIFLDIVALNITTCLRGYGIGKKKIEILYALSTTVVIGERMPSTSTSLDLCYKLVALAQHTSSIMTTYTGIKYLINEEVRASIAACLTSVVIPNTFTSIGRDAFRDSAFISITVPPSIVSIESNAFHNCSSLAHLSIPDKAVHGRDGDTRDTNNVFGGCKSLEAISASFNMSLIDYFSESHQIRIVVRVAVLTSLVVYQERDDALRESKRRKLNDGGSTSNSNFSQCSSAEMAEGLELSNKATELVSKLKEEKDLLRKEIEVLKEENNDMRKTYKILNAPLAYKKITAFELWREILEFV